MAENYDFDFTEIQKAFLSSEIAENGLKDTKTNALICLACLTAIQTLNEIPEKVKEALKCGATVTEIKEALYQTVPYIGFPRVKEALAVVNETFLAENIDPAEISQSTVTPQTRFEKGLAVQQQIFGKEHIDTMRENAPQETKHIQDCLSANCFGDYYTRGTLDLKMRELITFTVICSIGGCEPQAKAHAAANLSVGNTKQLLIDCITTCLPYIGYPRTLNAISCINEVCK
ncbi:MAG: carboxymuconolactone decarboxylase family protein [Ruminococcus flavefaciens]|nr:carboxymuconolactone decarboxylase family protein [Ruminococcus flavefaciens]MCM1060964.1 carboxymuconolactone decarboxylase family protein [Eubacterium sp.]